MSNKPSNAYFSNQEEVHEAENSLTHVPCFLCLPESPPIEAL